MAPKPAPGKGKDAGKSEDSSFRRRRLSVSDIDTSEFNNNQSPAPAQGRRQRRMSMSPEMGVVKPAKLLPFPMEIVGTYSCHGVEPGMRQGETSAKINQDRGCVCYPFNDDEKQALFCVFDGHGACGDKVSHYVMNNLQQLLEAHPDLQGNPAKALKESFVKVDEQLKADSSIDAELSGTTAVVMLMRDNQAWVANVGDSRAVLAQAKGSRMVAKNLSEDQKPDTPCELKRIKSKGGFVSPPEEEWGGPARVWLDSNMTLPGLAMARSIGDHLVSTIGVIAEPEVLEFSFNTTSDKFIVMASDGVWEFIESQPAIDIVAAFIENSATDGCTRLIETAAAKWRSEEGDYRDDITALCIKLPPWQC